MIVLTLTLGLLVLSLSCWFGMAGLGRLANVQLHGSALAVFAALAQVGSVVTQQHRLVWLAVSAACLCAFCWQNRGRVGIWLAAVGILLNFAAMGVNAGSMPLSTAAVARISGQQLPVGTKLFMSKGQVTEDANTPLAWLGDRLLLPGPFAGIAAWSVGDLLLIAGVAHVLWHTMKGTSHAQSTGWQRAPSS